MSSDDVIDNPTGWVAAHIRRYVASDGAKGHTWYGKPTLLITTVGRSSGARRRTALIYGQDGGNYVVVGSNGGKPDHPNWYLNLLANPEVDLQVGADRLSCRARLASDEERQRLWPLMAAILPQYNTYQKKTSRKIPVVVLEPVNVPAGPAGTEPIS